jgi:hypothetical protein
VQTLGIEGISKSQVSEMAKSIDEQVGAFHMWGRFVMTRATRDARVGHEISGVGAFCYPAPGERAREGNGP